MVGKYDQGSRLGGRMATHASRIRALCDRAARPILVVATVFFVAGCWYSIAQLGLSPGDVLVWPLAVLALLLGPVSVLYSAAGLHLLVRSAGRSLTFEHTLNVSAWATLAELLPVPGGAVVRAGALIEAGAPAGRSSLLVLLTALLWIALASLGAGAALAAGGLAAGWPLLIAGGLASLVTATWIGRIAGAALAVQMLLHRLAGMALIAMRLHLGFLALGTLVPLAQTFPFALAIIAGSAASIAPAGLAVSEGLAALVAGSLDVPPAVAFLAVAIDRVVCLGASALVAIAGLSKRARAARPAPCGGK